MKETKNPRIGDSSDKFQILRENMVETQIIARGISDGRVIEALKKVPRHMFVDQKYIDSAYDDSPLPIGSGQTISQPYIVALMTENLELTGKDKVLEIGTGCGYNAAVLSRIASHVYSIEIVQWLANLARENLDIAGVENVSTKFGDGFRGWPEKAPFDRIVVTAATSYIPKPLKKQLKTGGKLLAPVSNTLQKLILMEKISENEFKEHDLIYVRFVPMTGESEK